MVCILMRKIHWFYWPKQTYTTMLAKTGLSYYTWASLESFRLWNVEHHVRCCLQRPCWFHPIQLHPSLHCFLLGKPSDSATQATIWTSPFYAVRLVVRWKRWNIRRGGELINFCSCWFQLISQQNIFPGGHSLSVKAIKFSRGMKLPFWLCTYDFNSKNWYEYHCSSVVQSGRNKDSEEVQQF